MALHNTYHLLTCEPQNYIQTYDYLANLYYMYITCIMALDTLSEPTVVVVGCCVLLENVSRCFVFINYLYMF